MAAPRSTSADLDDEILAAVAIGASADSRVPASLLGDFLVDGPRGDRTRAMLMAALGPAIDRAAGLARGAARIALGGRSYDAIKTGFALEAVDRTLLPFRDEEFSRQQSGKIRALIAQRTKELPARDFVEMMRSAIKEDEWMLYAHGAIMGVVGGFIHLSIFGVGGGGR